MLKGNLLNKSRGDGIFSAEYLPFVMDVAFFMFVYIQHLVILKRLSIFQRADSPIPNFILVVYSPIFVCGRMRFCRSFLPTTW